MSVTYDTNWMGPVSLEWYKKQGLTQKATETLIADSVLVSLGRYNAGDVLEYDEITVHCASGRIDIRDDTKEGYDEYSVAPMLAEDWEALTEFLSALETEEQLAYYTLIDMFEVNYGKSITWIE
jgi:hypothetical protein